MKPKREFISTIYIIKEEKVLLIWNKKVGSFIPLGGHLEEDELPCEAAIREAKEESGFEIELINTEKKEITSPTGAKRVFLPQNFIIGLDVIKPDHHHINMGYVGKIINGQQLEKSDENTELRWFSKEEITNNSKIFDNVKLEAEKAIKLMEDYKNDC
ncbi:MAG: NUDIX domain-containing protein [archaeon]